jgi:hypothetical protein
MPERNPNSGMDVIALIFGVTAEIVAAITILLVAFGLGSTRELLANAAVMALITGWLTVAAVIAYSKYKSGTLA